MDEEPEIRRLLVANRGEIARRVFATCRRLGIETVAVHSDADGGMAFVEEADVAVRLPGNAPADTYLRGDLLVAAALRTGADAVHPGYGFLSENAAFARQVLEAGLTWVGPSPESIELMGSKVEAKKRMADAGVPVLAEIDPAAATEADLPLLVKASAGGGGRGMRVVRSLVELAAAVEQAGAEALAAFGDETVYCEPYVERGRHLEVQVWGDHHGNNVTILGARDCSVQRRHQKLIEEAPPTDLSDEVDIEEALFEAARAAARAIRYVGVGTVEFLYDPVTDRFWFLEMNTRLQVEHPVTECVNPGVDLVQLQLAAAEDPHMLSLGSTEPFGHHGHAVEARLYAEDPAEGWQPQSGRLTRFAFPGVSTEFGELTSYGVRVDSGFRAGDEVSTHYDAMLAKVIAWAPGRPEAIRRLAGTLVRAEIHGVRTNRDLLVNVLRHEAFAAADVSTDFFDRFDVADLARPRADEDAVRLSAFAAAVALAKLDAAGRMVQPGIPVGWRNVVSAPQLTRFTGPDGAEVEVRWYGGRGGYSSPDLDVTVLSTELSARQCAIALRSADNSERRFEVFVGEDGAVDVESSLGHVALRRLPRFVDPTEQVAPGSLLAPMPGTVATVSVQPGAEVSAGQPVLVLEAMKMQHTVTAPHDGVVTELPVTPGDQVAAGAVLAVVEATRTADEGDRR